MEGCGTLTAGWEKIGRAMPKELGCMAGSLKLSVIGEVVRGTLGDGWGLAVFRDVMGREVP